MATKIIKEIVTDVGGNTTIEYSDDTVQKYNVADVVTAVTNPLTGGISLQAGGVTQVAPEQVYSKTASDVVSGTGQVHLQATDTGQLWELTGAGYLTTQMYGSYISGTQNTYCHVNSGAKISKFVQYYSGPMATLEIGLNSALTDMIHANFSSGAGVSVSYWKTGVGSSQVVKFGIPIANCPNLDDGAPHKLELHMFGEFALTYADGILTSLTYDPNFPSITGNWCFSQIHGAGEKIYGIETYSGSSVASVNKPNLEVGLLSAVAVACSSLTVGKTSGVGFLPSSSSYFWTDDSRGHVFGSSATASIKARADSAGYSARLVAQSFIGIETSLRSGNDGVGSIQHQNLDRIKFPFNTSRVDFPVPVALPAYTVATLPSASVAYQRAFVLDALTPTFGATVASGGAVKVPVYSDGAAWKVG